MPILAAVASFLFPGTGQAFLGRIRPALIWAIAGFVPVIAMLWLPLAGFAFIAVRIASAIHAFIRIRRGDPGEPRPRPDIQVASAFAIGQVVVLALTQALVLEGFAPASSSMAPTLVIGDHVLVDKLTPRLGGYERGEVVAFDHPIFGQKFMKRIIAVGGDEVAVRKGVVYVNGSALPREAIGPASYWDRIDEQSGWLHKDVIASRERAGDHAYVVVHYPDQDTDEVWQHDYPAEPGTPGPGDPCVRTRDLPDAQRQLPPAPPLRVTADGKACKVPPGTYFVMGDNRDNSNDSRYWGVVPAGLMTGRVVGVWWSGGDKIDSRWARIGRID